ncbi:MAG: Fur family transcriptional regulator [Elusimicrobiota bacterium]
MITNRKQRPISAEQQLLAHHIKPTFQRLKVLEFLSKSCIHPTVDMIYRELVATIPTMSKTTVYNTLKSFVDKGIVSSLMITGTEARFEYARQSHHHFICEKCNSIMDIVIACPHAVKRSVGGHTIKEQHGYFKGICADCAKKEAVNEAV